MKTNLLNVLAHAADEAQLSLRPLPPHAASNQTEHLRNHYALLLASVLTAQSTVSESQTRLLRLLLDSLSLGDIRGPLFEQARELSPEQLLEAARLIREAGFAHHLVVDVLVLLRLDAPLNEDSTRLASELAAFLGFNEADLTQRAKDAADILGLHNPLDEVDHPHSEQNGEEVPSARGTTLLAELWPSQLSQQLTADALRDGLQGGLWFLDANLDVDFPWLADDAVLVFRNGAMLNTFAKVGKVKLVQCRLINAALSFQGACSIYLEHCDWRGDYDPALKCTALSSVGQALTVIGCKFSTRNARAILVENNILTLKECDFYGCGHEELDAGAVEFNSRDAKTIEACNFLECKGKRAGAISVVYLSGIRDCQFVACSGAYESPFLNGAMPVDIAIYCGNYSELVPVEGCVFRKCSAFVYIRISTVVFVKTQFLDANIYFKYESSGEPQHKDCSFVNGVIRKL